MGDPFLNLRQIATPKGNPQNGGNLLYFKSDGKLYTKNASGVETAVETALGDVTLAGAQTLTNKTISADNNTLSGIAASSFVLSNGSGNIDGAAAQKVIPAGVVVGDTDTQTVTNKTLSTGTKVGAATTDISGAYATYTPTFVNLTVGNGTLVGRYMQIGKQVHFVISLVFGSTTTVAGAVTVTIPVTALSTELGPHACEIFAATAAVRWIGDAVNSSTTALAIFQPTSSTNVTLVQLGSVGLSLGTSSRILIRGTYEAA